MNHLRRLIQQLRKTRPGEGPLAIKDSRPWHIRTVCDDYALRGMAGFDPDQG